jgi:hypothetical protein
MAFTAISKLDPVSRNCVWEEHVRKESKMLKLTDTFMVTNPDKSRCLHPDAGQHNRVQWSFTHAFCIKQTSPMIM